MTSAISGNSFGMHRHDPSQMASKLFAKLDTKNQGYIEKSDLQSAFDQIAAAASSSSATSTHSTASVDEVFKQLDSNSDGKVTQDEMTSSLKKLSQDLESQFHQSRMQGAGGMPPPPPGGGQGADSGFTKDELSSQLSEIGSSDSQRSSLISKVVNNFDAADTDGDGKVSFQEAMAYDQKTSSNTSSTGTTSTTTATSTSDSSTASTEASVLKRILQLMHAYGQAASSTAQSATTSSVLSTSA